MKKSKFWNIKRQLQKIIIFWDETKQNKKKKTIARSTGAIMLNKAQL